MIALPKGFATMSAAAAHHGTTLAYRVMIARAAKPRVATHKPTPIKLAPSSQSWETLPMSAPTKMSATPMREAAEDIVPPRP